MLKDSTVPFNGCHYDFFSDTVEPPYPYSGTSLSSKMDIIFCPGRLLKETFPTSLRRTPLQSGQSLKRTV